MTHLVIENQSSNIEIVSAAIIQKVYEMALSAEGDVSLKGNLQSDHAKQTAYDYLTGNLTGTSTKRFPQLSLNVTGGIYIDFQDSLVEQILLSKNLGDGVGVTQSDLYAINTLEGSWFGGSNITSFNELQYFKPSAVSQQGTFQNCNYLTEVTLPSGITRISTYLFKSCDVLETINNTQSITEVMQGGLTECPNLESLNLQSLTTVGQYAFQQDTNLQSIGTGAPTTIGAHAFENCQSLTSIDLSNCTSIAEYTFKNCSSLTSIDLSHIQSIGNYAFSECSSLTRIVTDNTLTSLGSNAFYGCSGATEIDLSASTSLTSIPSTAFTNSEATKVSIPPSVTSIGDWAFNPKDSNVSRNRDYYIYATTPPTLASTRTIVPSGIVTMPHKIYVPASTDSTVLNAYKTASIWSQFASVMEEMPST